MFCKLAALLFILPVALLAQEPQEDPLKLNDIIITGSSIGGDVIINGNPSDGGSYDDPQISTQGNVTFDNGCTFENENVYECDGTQRRMTPADKKKLIKRQALIQRKQKKMGSSKKNHPKNSKAKPQKASRAQKTRTNKNKNNNKRGLVRKHNLDTEDEKCDEYAPCESC